MELLWLDWMLLTTAVIMAVNAGLEHSVLARVSVINTIVRIAPFVALGGPRLELSFACSNVWR